MVLIASSKQNISLAALGIVLFFAVGIAIPKLTVHDMVPADADRSCVEQVLNKPIKKLSWEWIVRATGQTQVVAANATHGDVKFYTLFRIPLDLNISINCLQAETPNPIVSTAKVPEGWYSHQTGGYDGSQTILTRSPELPKADPNNYAYGEHIAIVERDISLTPPDQYVERNVSVSGPAVQFARWGTLFGRKMLSIGFTDPNDNSRQQYTYLFGGGKFVLINLYPDKQENRAAYQQVVNYYAQTLSIISRAETLAACKTVVFTPGQEKNAQIDPETGYVTADYTKDDKQITAFFNYNDDLSQCLPDVAEFLRSVKAGADKMTQ